MPTFVFRPRMVSLIAGALAAFVAVQAPAHAQNGNDLQEGACPDLPHYPGGSRPKDRIEVIVKWFEQNVPGARFRDLRRVLVPPTVTVEAPNVRGYIAIGIFEWEKAIDYYC